MSLGSTPLESDTLTREDWLRARGYPEEVIAEYLERRMAQVQMTSIDEPNATATRSAISSDK